MSTVYDWPLNEPPVQEYPLPMKDRLGLEYDDLLAVQRQHLKAWRDKLNDQTFAGIERYCHLTNRPATTPEDKHRVFRGQTLVMLVMEYPNFNNEYLPVITPSNWMFSEYVEILEVGKKVRPAATPSELI